MSGSLISCPLKSRRGDRSELVTRVRSKAIGARAVQRARLVSPGADASRRAIGEIVGVHDGQVGMWEKRYEVPALAR